LTVKHNPECRFEVHLSTEDAEYFDVRISHGEVSFCLWDVHEYEINKIIEDLKSQVYLYKVEYGN